MERRLGVGPARRGCRVVTTAMTARLLLAHQLRAIDEVRWTVVSGDRFDDAPPGLEVEIVPIRREFALSDVGAALRLWRLFRRERFDFVQTHTPKASFLGLPAARLAGTRAVYTIHGALWFRDNTRLANLLGWLFERWCCAWAHVVLVQSEEDRVVLPMVGICRAAKIRYVGNGVDLDRFSAAVDPADLGHDAPPSPVSAPGAAVASGPATRPVVVMVSRLVREKGCLDFFALARTLRGRATFVHVGPTEDDQSDAISAGELAAAAPDVTFLGAVGDIRPQLAAADLVVQPSYREGIPRVAMEASAAGRCVVAYDVRGMREVVDPGSGVLVDRGDTAALCAVVAGLLDDPGRRHALGQAGRARVLERFSEDAVVTRLRAVYDELAEAGPPRRRPGRVRAGAGAA